MSITEWWNGKVKVLRPPGRAPNCSVCGRFLYWDDEHGHFVCTRAHRESLTGEWGHK